MFSANNFISGALAKRQENNSLRSLSVQRNLVDLCSNDYLGFASSAILQHNIKNEFNAILYSPVSFNQLNGSGGSRLLAGNTEYALYLENYIAKYHNHEAALLFNSGYDANVGLFSSLPQRGDTILYDELVHASIRDGIRLSLAFNFKFKHNDLSDLEDKLKKAKGIIYVAVESVYSMDGDFASLIEISKLCKKYNANLIVDEAHATGIYGNKGNGLCNELNILPDIFACVYTYGKAMGCHGAAVCGSEPLKKYLINFARSFIYTTAMPVHGLISIQCSYDLLEHSQGEIDKLRANIKLFTELLSQTNLTVLPSQSAIQSIVIGGNEKTKKLGAAIQKTGFDVRPILYPTVAKGLERLRICLHSFNTEDEIKGLVDSLSSLR